MEIQTISVKPHFGDVFRTFNTFMMELMVSGHIFYKLNDKCPYREYWYLDLPEIATSKTQFVPYNALEWA